MTHNPEALICSWGCMLLLLPAFDLLGSEPLRLVGKLGMP